MSSLPSPYLTPEQYLELERKNEFRSEYVDGQMYALAGASRWHNRVERNVLSSLHNQLKDGPCEAYGSSLRVRPKVGGPYYYPDVTVVCGEAKFEDESFDTLLNPKVVIEVLSPSTQTYDRGEKFERYRVMPSLSEYLLIAQNRVHIVHRILQPGGRWDVSETKDASGILELPSVGARLNMADIYHRVDFKS